MPAIAARQPVLEARDLGFGYASATPVFERVSLEVAPREIVCLLGASGCGKSTLLRRLGQLEPADASHAGHSSGRIRFLGEPLTAPHPRAAMVFQQPGLLPWLDAARNVGFGLDFARQPRLEPERRTQRVAEALAAVGLDGKGRLFPSQLSGGMAQRVALARALAREPVLLLADEPFSALDAITRAQMQDLLVELVHRWQTAALLVTHDIDEAILVGDRILLMGGQPGRIVREWRVDIGRPRTADAAAFSTLRLDIFSALHAAHTPGRADLVPSSPSSSSS